MSLERRVMLFENSAHSSLNIKRIILIFRPLLSARNFLIALADPVAMDDALIRYSYFLGYGSSHVICAKKFFIVFNDHRPF